MYPLLDISKQRKRWSFQETKRLGKITNGYKSIEFCFLLIAKNLDLDVDFGQMSTDSDLK